MRLRFVFVPIGFSLVLGACGSDVPSDQQDLDLVVTSYEAGYDFNQPTTYALPDKVVVITDPGATATDVDPGLSQNVLQMISTQLNGRGYTQLETGGGNPPSMFVEVSKMSTVTTQVYYSYWSSYYGSYYAPYYGGAYGVGWAPYPVPYVTSATLGSLIINVTDPNHPNTAEQKIPSIWAAVLNGVVDNSTTAQIQQRVDTGIQQAFAQSPYFTRSSQ